MLFPDSKNELANTNMGMQEMSLYSFQNQMKSELKSPAPSAGGKFRLHSYENLPPALHGATQSSWGPDAEQNILRGLVFFRTHHSLCGGVEDDSPEGLQGTWAFLLPALCLQSPFWENLSNSVPNCVVSNTHTYMHVCTHTHARMLTHTRARMRTHTRKAEQFCNSFLSWEWPWGKAFGGWKGKNMSPKQKLYFNKSSSHAGRLLFSLILQTCSFCNAFTFG